MPELLKAPVTPAQQARDTLLGALVGLARATTNEPKTDDTDEVLNAGLRLAAQPDAPEERLQRMLAIVQTEKHRVAPGCATCAMPCGNTNDYDFVRLWAAPESIRTLKLQMLSAAFALAQKRPQGQAQASFCSPLPRTGTRNFLPLLCNAPRSFAGSKSGPESRRFYPPGL